MNTDFNDAVELVLGDETKSLQADLFILERVQREWMDELDRAEADRDQFAVGFYEPHVARLNRFIDRLDDDIDDVRKQLNFAHCGVWGTPHAVERLRVPMIPGLPR
jgi:hypothetical protein